MKRFSAPTVTSAVALTVVIASTSPSVAAQFARGDVDGSGGISVIDAVHVLRALFQGAPGVLSCQDAADADDSGSLDVTDALFLLNALFQNGPSPSAPFPTCGDDPTPDALDCSEFDGCSVSLYGLRIVTDSLYFVIDRSGSAWPVRSRFDAVKQEIARGIGQLPDSAEFGFVGYDANVVRFPESGVPITASEEGVASGTAWITSLPGGAGSCPAAGLLAAIDMANRSVNDNRVIAYVGDGGGTCPGTGLHESEYLEDMLLSVSAANTRDIVIYGLVPDDLNPFHRDILDRLVGDSGGSWSVIPR